MSSRKRTLTKEQILARIEKIDPNIIYPLNALACDVQLSDSPLMRRARAAGVLLSHPVRTTHQGKPIAAIKGSDAIRFLKDMTKTMHPNRTTSRIRNRIVLQPSVPIHAQGVPYEIPPDKLAEALSVYSILRDEVAKHPVALAKAALSVLHKQYLGK